MIVKVCGMRESENIRNVEQCGAELMGFIFYPRSARYVDKQPTYLPHCQRVGVFVNQPSDEIERLAGLYRLDYIQLHGNETPQQCTQLKDLGLKIIKAFSITTEHDFAATDAYQGLCDYFLFDTACSGYGGSGRSFDWDLLSEYKNDTGFLLSGGINPSSVEALKKITHPRLLGVDINSGFEIQPALKDAQQINEFIKQLKSPSL